MYILKEGKEFFEGWNQKEKGEQKKIFLLL